MYIHVHVHTCTCTHVYMYMHVHYYYYQSSVSLTPTVSAPFFPFHVVCRRHVRPYQVEKTWDVVTAYDFMSHPATLLTHTIDFHLLLFECSETD